MGAAVSPGVAAATKAASPNELEGMFSTFSEKERSKLGVALAQKENDALFNQVDKNKDGVIDAWEWALAREEHLVMQGTDQKTPMEHLLDKLDKEGTGRIDAAEVISAIETFNSLDKPEPLKTSEGDEMQKPKVGTDGKVGRKALEALITLFLEGPPARSLEQLAEVFQEIYLIKKVFVEWADGKESLDAEVVNSACAIFNTWAARAHSSVEDGRMKYYDPSQQGGVVSNASFTKWVWGELKTLEEKLSQPFLSLLGRLRRSMFVSTACGHGDWEGLESVDPALLGPILAASDGRVWEEMEATEQKDLESRAVERCGLQLGDDGRVAAKDVQRWAREEVIHLPADHAPTTLARLAAFLPPAACDEAHYKVGRSFRTWDVDGRGSIAREELRSVMAKIEDFSQEELDALMYGARPDADGRIDYAEFTKWVLAAPEPVAA